MNGWVGQGRGSPGGVVDLATGKGADGEWPSCFSSRPSSWSPSCCPSSRGHRSGANDGRSSGTSTPWTSCGRSRVTASQHPAQPASRRTTRRAPPSVTPAWRQLRRSTPHQPRPQPHPQRQRQRQRPRRPRSHPSCSWRTMLPLVECQEGRGARPRSTRRWGDRLHARERSSRRSRGHSERRASASPWAWARSSSSRLSPSS